jgi:hypothetical protein
VAFQRLTRFLPKTPKTAVAFTGVTPRRDAYQLTSVRWSQTGRFAKTDVNKTDK